MKYQNLLKSIILGAALLMSVSAADDNSDGEPGEQHHLAKGGAGWGADPVPPPHASCLGTLAATGARWCAGTGDAFDGVAAAARRVATPVSSVVLQNDLRDDYRGPAIVSVLDYTRARTTDGIVTLFGLSVVFNRHTRTYFLNPRLASERLPDGAKLFEVYPGMPYVHHCSGSSEDVTFFNVEALRAEDSDNPRSVRVPYEVLAQMLREARYEVDVEGKPYSIRDQLGRACRGNFRVLAAFAIRPAAGDEEAHLPAYLPTQAEEALTTAICTRGRAAAGGDGPMGRRSFAAAAKRHGAGASGVASARGDGTAGW